MKKLLKTWLLVTLITVGGVVSAYCEDVTLSVIKSSGGIGTSENIVRISLSNQDTTVRSLQFTLSDLPDDLRVDSLRSTQRTWRMETLGNEIDGGSVIVMQISQVRNVIPPGSGPIIEIFYSVDKNAQLGSHELTLSNVFVADVNNHALTVELVNAKFQVLNSAGVTSFTPNPQEYELLYNYPNPFTPQTNINFAVMKAGRIKLSIYNSIGQLVNILSDEEKNIGLHQVIWDGRDNFGNFVSSGTFFCVMETSTNVVFRKIMYIH